MRISDRYRQANIELHRSNENYGTAGRKRAARVREVIGETGCQTILDYGCGKGLLAASLPDHDIAEYDPAIPGKDAEPRPAELVVCTDVLEHIEPECLDAVLDHLRGLATRYLFANISTRLSTKHLSDGRNTHLIVQRPDWWRARLDRFFLVKDWSATGDTVTLLAEPRPSILPSA